MSDLSRVPRVRVTPYASTQPYRNSDPVDAARRLHVDAIVSGALTLERDGPAVRVRLVDAAKGAELWAHQFDRSMMTMLDVQQEISREISRRLRPDAASSRVSRQTGLTVNSAYDLYLKGLYAVNQRSAESVTRGLEYLRESALRNPSYAPAYAGLGHGYANQAFMGTQPAVTFFPQAITNTQKALELDPNLVEAHRELGYLKALADYDWAGAEREFLAALALNPNDAASHDLYATWVLMPTGRKSKAVAEIDQAVNNDPQSTVTGFHRAWILYELRQYDEAEKQLRKTIALDPAFVYPHILFGLVYTAQQKYAQAAAECNTPPYTPGGNSRQLTELAYVYAKAGDREHLDPLLREIDARLRNGYVNLVNLADIYAALGNLDRTFELLDRAYRDREPSLIRIPNLPSADDFRSDPRCDQLLRKMFLK
jgi:tetratricopeptide (TPR) repeat protein